MEYAIGATEALVRDLFSLAAAVATEDGRDVVETGDIRTAVEEDSGGFGKLLKDVFIPR